MNTITTTAFLPDAERYVFDFSLCTYAKGWAQIDTYQDASYFGIWTNPWRREIVTYCEGDYTEERALDDAGYADALRRCLLAYRDGTDRWPHAKIDAGIRDRFRFVDRFAALGCAAYIH